MRIQKFLANQGVASRRAIEAMILAGDIKVNGYKAKIGQLISSTDRVVVKGQLIRFKQLASRTVIVYYKTDREICSRIDAQGRPNVFSSLPRISIGKWHMVGRLDFTTSGLLLFTNDGDLAHRLMHPSYHLDREYLVRVYGRVTEQHLQMILAGVLLDGKPARFADIQPRKTETGLYQSFSLVVQEGRKHEIKRVFASQGIQVARLKRIRYGNIILSHKLRPGRWLQLDYKEMNDLAALVDLSAKPLLKVR